MKMFGLAVNQANQAQRNAITTYFKNLSWGYWHWFPDFWVLHTRVDEETAEAIRNAVQSLAPGLHCIVLPLDTNSAWAGFGSTQWKEWFDRHWTREGP